MEKIVPKFNGVKLTEESMDKARQHFIDNCQACIDEIKSGEVKVEDPEACFKWKREMAEQFRQGKSDYTFTFLQHAYYIQTGESIPFLS